jgi:hypothetical protein
VKLFAVFFSLALAAPAFAGGPARPAVWLQGHDGRGHAFDLASLRGRVVAITFASRYTAHEADRIHAALLAHAGESGLEVVNVVDLMGVPSLFHGYARRKVAEHDRPGRILHLVDEHGQLRRVFGVEPAHRVDILIIDRQGVLRGRFAGQAELAQALRLLDSLDVASPAPSAAIDRAAE